MSKILAAYVAEDTASVYSDKVTHWLLAYMQCNADASINLDNPSGLSTLIGKIRVDNPTKPILISIGGTNSDPYNFGTVVADSGLRATFISNVLSMISTYELDGVDINYEYPNNTTKGAQFVSLLSELKTALPSGKLLTFASANYDRFATTDVDVVTALSYCDFTILMGYDYNDTGHHSQLYLSEIFATPDNVIMKATGDNLVQLWIGLVNKAKIVFGVPFYGLQGWGTTYSYATLVADYEDKNGWTKYFDNVAKNPWLEKSGSDNIFYEDEESITEKSNYSMTNDIGGMAMWRYENDNGTDLLDIMGNILNPVIEPPVEPPTTLITSWDEEVNTEHDVTIKINDVEKSILFDTLNIKTSVANRSEATFDMIINNKNEIKLGNHVDISTYIYNDSIYVYMFAGRIKNINIKPVTIGGQLIANVECVDYNHVLDRILVAEEYVNKSLYYIVNDIYQKYLINEWVAIASYPSNSVIIEKAVFSYISISDCFKYLCDETAYNMLISNDGWINFFYKDDIITNNIELRHILDVNIKYTLDDYRNKQFIKGGFDETPIINEVLTPKPDGNTTTFFSRYPLGTVPTVKVDGTTVSAISVGIDGIDTDKWFYWNKNVNKLAQNTELLGTLSSGTISMDYNGLVKILVEADNVDGQTEMADNETSTTVIGTGVYSNIEEVGSIQTRNEAINYAQGLLNKYNKIPESVDLKSFVYREVGTMVFVNYPNLTDDQLLFVESRDTYLENGRLRYNYQLLNGESLGDWTEFFRKIYKQSQDMLINDDLQLIKLQSQPESWDVCSEYIFETFNLTYLSDTAYIGENVTLGIAEKGKQYYPTYLSDTAYIDDDKPIGIVIDTGETLKDI